MNEPKFALGAAVQVNAGDSTARATVVNVFGLDLPSGKQFRYRVRLADQSERTVEEAELQEKAR